MVSLFECEKLNRKFIGFDINNEMIEYVKSKMQDSQTEYQVSECDVTDNIQGTYNSKNKKSEN